jgi:hypothetical protein
MTMIRMIPTSTQIHHGMFMTPGLPVTVSDETVALR